MSGINDAGILLREALWQRGFREGSGDPEKILDKIIKKAEAWDSLVKMNSSGSNGN